MDINDAAFYIKETLGQGKNPKLLRIFTYKDDGSF